MVIARILWAFLVRDVLTARSYRLAWALGLWSGVFELVLFYFLSPIVRLSDVTDTAGQTMDYFQFVVIGLALYTFLITGVGVFANSLRAEQTVGTLEVLLSLPVSPTLTMFGVATYGFGRSLLNTFIMLTIAGIFFGLRVVTDPLVLVVAFVTLLASIMLFASLGIVVAALTIVFKQAGAFIGISIQGIGLLSGVFFPLELLPRPLQLLGEVIPLTWALNILRQALLLGEVSATRVAFLVIASILAMPVSFFLFHLAVQRARRDGSLGQY